MAFNPIRPLADEKRGRFLVSWVRRFLAAASDLSPERQDALRRASKGCLHGFKEQHARASLASAKASFDGEKRAGRDREEAREAVRWFCRDRKVQYPARNDP